MKQALIFIAMLLLVGCGIADNDPVMVKIYEFGELQKEGNTYKIPIVKSFSYVSVNVAARDEPYKWYEPEFFGLIVGGNADTIIIIDTSGIVYPDMQIELRFIRRGNAQQSAVYPLEYFRGGRNNHEIKTVSSESNRPSQLTKKEIDFLTIKPEKRPIIWKVADVLIYSIAGGIVVILLFLIISLLLVSVEKTAPGIGKNITIENLISDVAELKKEQSALAARQKAITETMTELLAELLDKPNGRR